jgi:hypothetical protein
MCGHRRMAGAWSVSMHAFDWFRRQLKDRRSRKRRVSVWVLEDLGAAYVANPKVASSAIRNLIRDRESERLFGRVAGEDAALRSRVEKRVKWTLTPERMLGLHERYRLFSFVRNPLTRLYSCYRDKVVNAQAKRARCTLCMYGIEFGMSFDEFVKRVVEIPDERADQHFRSQHTFLMWGETLLVNELGRLERFEADWARIGGGLVLPGREHRVSGPTVGVRELPLGREAAKRAVERYRRDIEVFGYEEEVAEL